MYTSTFAFSITSVEIGDTVEVELNILHPFVEYSFLFPSKSTTRRSAKQTKAERCFGN